MPQPAVFKRIKNGDYQVRKAYANPDFRVTSTGASGSGYGVRQALFMYNTPALETFKVDNDPTNSYDGSYQSVIWRSIDHMYYKYPYDPANTFEHYGRETTKNLYRSASIVTVPYAYKGERIEPGSVIITGSRVHFRDDVNGNLFDYSTASFHTITASNIAHLSFNHLFRSYKTTTINGPYYYNSDVYDSSIRPATITDCQLTSSFNYGGSHTGEALNIPNSGSFLRIPSSHELTFDKNKDFAISFWVKFDGMGIITTNNGLGSAADLGDLPFFSNDFVKSEPYLDKRAARTYVRDVYNNSWDDRARFPWKFSISSSLAGSDYLYHVTAKRGDGTSTIKLSSAAITLTNIQTWNWVGFVKNGSSLSLYINDPGTPAATATDSLSVNPTTDYDIFIGRKLNGTGTLTVPAFNIAEAHIYNDNINTNDLADLYSGSLGTRVVGNVFYRHGQVVISPLKNSLLRNFDANAWTLSYQGTHAIYENEVLVRVPKDEFNLTLNPTAVNSSEDPTLKSAFTGSNSQDSSGSLTPYITTIGLYNDKLEMLAVAKLGQAVQKRDDIDMNFVIRWDI
jgi:hypothetical protein